MTAIHTKISQLYAQHGARSIVARRVLSSFTNTFSHKCAHPKIIPREVNMRVHLTMLQWFLQQELPKKFPQVFTPELAIEPLPQQGWSNFAFLVRTLDKDFVVRMRAENGNSVHGNHWAPYHKEEWILQAVQSKVLAPQVIGDGIGYVATPTEVRKYSYFIQTYIACASADTIAAALNPQIFREKLGAIAQAINSIPCTGFGTEFSALTNSFVQLNWRDAVCQDIKEANIERLMNHGIVTRSEAGTLQKRLMTLATLDFNPALYHGDFVENWSNVLADRNGHVHGIIDWELAGAGPATQMECALLLYMMIRDGRTKQQIATDFSSFLRGYGLSEQEYRERFAYDVETIILLQALKKCNRYLDIDAAGGLREHAWRMRFFERGKSLISLGARLSECESRQLLFSY